MVTKAELFSMKAPELSLDYETIDGDGHTAQQPEGWYKPYLPKKYWEWAPKADENYTTVAEGREFPLPHPLLSTSLGIPLGWKLADPTEVTPEDLRKRAGVDVNDRLKYMTEDGVGISYLYPTELLVMPWALASSAFAMAYSAAYNDWVHDWCSADPHRLRPVAVVPPQDTILAVEELERVAKKGFKAVMVRPNTCLGQDVDHPNMERFWAAAQDLDMAIGIHEGFSQGSPYMPRLGQERTKNWYQLHAFEHPAEHMMASMLMITSGVMHRYPKLRVGFMESGAGWAGFWLHHLDEHHEKLIRMYPELAPESATYYFQRQCFLGVEPDYAQVPHLIECGLEECLVFSSDFPHFDAIWPGSVAAMADRKDMTDVQKRKALRDNALRMYGVTK